MRDENELTAAQKSVEAALAGLRPAAPAVGPDVLMFRAGRAAGIRQVQRWQAAASTLGVLLVAAIVFRPAAPAPRIIYVEKAVPVPTMPTTDEPADIGPAAHTPSALAYLTLRDDVLNHGVDALRSPAARLEYANHPRPAPERAFEPPPAQRKTGYFATFEKLFESGVGS
jgi:hypothetical protein